MKYLELLEQIELVEAARDRYVGMLNFFDQLPQTGGLRSVRQWAEGQLEWAANTLRNSDRITWFMRYVKIAAMARALEQLGTEANSMEQLAATEQNPSVAKRAQELKAASQSLSLILDKEVKKMDRAAKTEVAKELQLAQQQAKAGNEKLEKVRAKCQQNPNAADCGLNLEALEQKVEGLNAAVNILASFGQPGQQENIGVPDPESLSGIMNSLTHLESINYQPMHDYRFGSKPISVVISTMIGLEKQWAEKQRSTITHDDPDVEKVLDFGDGKAWFNLHRSYCNREGAAMGHCGNQYDNMESSDKVLSFRTLQGTDESGNELWKPHLTFIWDSENGMLGEMKGRSNTKPTATYHPYIIPLLQQDWVKGILKRPHQHAKANDFYLSDLPEETARELAEQKPNLLTYKDRKALGMDASMDDMELEKVNEELSEHNIEEIHGMYDEDTFMLDRWNNKEAVYNDLSQNGWPDEYFVEDLDRDQVEKLVEMLDDETKNLIRAYTGLQYTDEAKEWIDFDEEEEGRDFALSDLSLDEALRVLHEESDDELDNAIGKKWKEYHTEGMQEDARYAVDSMGDYADSDYEYNIQDIGESNQENNFDPPLALTMDMDYFFSEIFPNLEQISKGSYHTMDWKGILRLFVYDISDSYWENFNTESDSMQYFAETVEEPIKAHFKGLVEKLKEHDAYEDMVARKLFLQRQQELGLDRPEQPEEPVHKGAIPQRTDVDIDL